MKTYLLVKGKQGTLIGDPFSNRFLGQRKLPVDQANPPKNVGAAYEPQLAVTPKHPDTMKHVRRGELEVVEEFQARNFTEALTRLDVKADSRSKEKK
jgi:hypothetical protein